MTTSIRLGRILGVEVGFNWTLVFFCALVAWTLATDVLPKEVGGYPALLYWLVAAAGAVVFVACLLAHELSHAVVARRNGVKVSGITLWLFGGVARLDGEPSSARAEALIAGVGPLTSLGVAALALGIAFAAQPNALLSDVFLWLAYVNVALALFNLVPAFPLDGGRLLSAFLWWRAGSRQRGVHLAVRVGRIFAYLMIAGGV
ncbi:MAG TPA: site-2 protease family protein, partial [Candidatus Dormibacteraeota bacterium]|nr:site-2 protease family protein [Candidatus Dormibacteraeota bacterium]